MKSYTVKKIIAGALIIGELFTSTPSFGSIRLKEEPIWKGIKRVNGNDKVGNNHRDGVMMVYDSSAQKEEEEKKKKAETAQKKGTKVAQDEFGLTSREATKEPEEEKKKLKQVPVKQGPKEEQKETPKEIKDTLGNFVKNVASDVDRNFIWNAIQRAYILIDEDDKKQFIDWLNTMSKEEKIDLVNKIVDSKKNIKNVPYEVVKNEFYTWKTKQEKLEEKITREEKELLNYPSIVREKDISFLVSNFKDKPTDENLSLIQMRYGYLEKKREVFRYKNEDIKEIDKEIKQLEDWLKKLKLETGSVTERLDQIRTGMRVLKIDYTNLSPENADLIVHLRNLKLNEELFKIYWNYILLLDNKSAKMFQTLKRSSPTFFNDMKQIVTTTINRSKYESGQGIWYSNYYQAILSSQSDVEKYSHNEFLAYSNAATLSPLVVTAFQEYATTAANMGVTSPEEKKLVATTVAKLYSLEPLLAYKYLNALRNIAEICEGNPEAYMLALMSLTARIDVETSAVYSGVSAAQIQLNIRRTVNRLDYAFDTIAELTPTALSRYTRYQLMDTNIEVDQERAPHEIRLKSPGWAPQLLLSEDLVSSFYPPYPFPLRLKPDLLTNVMNMGGVATTYNYGGNINLPWFNLQSISSKAREVKAAHENYLRPKHPNVGISEYLPSVQISSVSSTQLLNEINKAFVSIEPPEYSSQIIGGGGFAGVGGKKETEIAGYQYYGGGLGSLVTPTGGYAVGGSIDLAKFVGMTAVGVPIGSIPASVMTARNTRGEIRGIDTALAGYQELDDETKKLLARAIVTSWNPNNPSNVLVVVNREENAEGKSWMQARYFLIDKDGRIFDLKGGKNDFVDMLNYIAGYGDKNFGTPATYTWNYERTIERGGGALAIDLGTTSVLTAVQAVPFLADKKNQPLLVEWVPAFAVTSEEKGATTVHEFSFPGRYMKIKSDKEGNFIEQGGNYKMRVVEGKKAWELDLGLDVVSTPSGKAYKGGFFYKKQIPKSSWGGGIYYEAQKTNLWQTAYFVNQAKEMSKYIEELHRVAFTLYGEEAATQVMLGALAHIVPQFKSTAEGIEFDNMFYRFIGFIKGLEKMGKIDVSRYQSLDVIITEYNSMVNRVTQDPSNADTYLDDFKKKYADSIKDVFDKYYLGVQVNKDFSLEFGLYSKEKDGNWYSQFTDKETVQSVYARALYTFDSGFIRAFASIPVWGTGVTEKGVQTAGIVGTGVGFDVLGGMFLQRLAFDAGLTFVSKKDNKSPIASSKKGPFIQGDVQLFSNIVEDTKQYRELEQKYREYLEYIKEDRMGDIPQDVREKMVQDYRKYEKEYKEAIGEEILKRIENGENVSLTPEQKAVLSRVLWYWFYDEKFKLEKEFNGHTRAYLGGAAFFGMGNNVWWDIGAFVEYVGRLEAYIIVARREALGLYTGGDLKLSDKITFSGIGGVVLEKGTGGGFSASYNIKPDIAIGVFGYAENKTPEYTHPAYPPYEDTGVPNFGVIFFINFGNTEKPPTIKMMENILQPEPGQPAGFER